MTHTEELLALASLEGYSWTSIPSMEFKQLVELVRLQHEALKHSHPSSPIWKTPHKEAIAAFNKFEGGE